MPLDKSKFALLEDRKVTRSKFFVCDNCSRTIYVPRKQKSIVCYKCGTKWDLHEDFASGTGKFKGVQIYYDE